MEGVKKWGIKVQDVYLTPDELFQEMEEEFGVKNLKTAFDPCPFPAADEDGLQIPWKTPCFVNPPFSKCVLWIRKAKEEAKRGVTTYMVVPWYAYYGTSACKKELDLPMPPRHGFEFRSPITRKIASMNVMFVKFGP